MGKGAGAVEGAYGAAEGTNLSVGGFYHMDDGAGADGNDVFGVEAYFTMGALAVAAEYGDYDAADGSGFSVTASYLFTEMYEAAVRFENFESTKVDIDGDDAADDASVDIIRVGVNRYSAGHNLKWTLQYSMIDSELNGDDVSPDDEIALGATLAF
jgi:predicted porin